MEFDPAGLIIGKLDAFDPEEYFCENQKSFGDINLCLVEMDGMIECYSHPKVKVNAELGRYFKNEILGIYLNEKTYDKVEYLGTFNYDDYFKVYAMTAARNMSFSVAELDNLALMFENNYMKENWSSFKDKIEKNFSYMSVDRPILLESHSPHKQIRSLVTMMKMIVEDDEQILVATINLVQIKNRLIFYAYYKDYFGETSVAQAKAKSDYFGLKLVDEN
jgi:hypothetical protein